MKRVIITGPTGAIGMALIEYLSNKNIEVIAVVRGDSRRKNQIHESETMMKVECALARVDQLPHKVQKAVKEKNWNKDIPIDVFYHFAWMVRLEIVEMICICKIVMLHLHWMQSMRHLNWDARLS